MKCIFVHHYTRPPLLYSTININIFGDEVYKRKPRNLDILWNEIQAVCREISLDVLIRCTESVVTRTQNCIDAAGHLGRPRTATSDESSTAVLELFQRSPNKSSRQGARESLVSASSVLRILNRGKYRVYIPRLVQKLNDDDPHRRLQFCEWIQEMVMNEYTDS
ncbi:hypothetical protein Btru_056437 [Bulinus truncatus]|nr:hypothetical protein Btru_056437 [Bulinus truncatus]